MLGISAAMPRTTARNRVAFAPQREKFGAMQRAFVDENSRRLVTRWRVLFLFRPSSISDKKHDIDIK
jgi:hypothetical protein